MKLKVNKDAKVSSFTYIRPGTYPMQVVSMEEKQGPAGTYLCWTLSHAATNLDEFQDINGEALGDRKPSSLKHNTTLKEEAQGMLREFYEACGNVWDGEVDTELCIGKVLGVTIKNETYEGTERNKVGRVTTWE